MATITTAPAPSTAAATPIVRGPHAVAIGLLLLVWLSCIWFGSNPYNPNTATRLFAAISLVEDGDATIDQFQTDTLDKATFNGRLYSDKNPGMTLMAMPAVSLADALSGDRARDHTPGFFNRSLSRFVMIRQQLAVATASAVLLGLASVLLLDLATGITGSPRAGLVTALAYALGTPAWGWSTTLFGHAPVGALLLIAAWAVWRGTSGARELARWRYPLLLGLALGWAIVIELAAALPVAVIGLWAIWRTRGGRLCRRAGADAGL
jgi:4-amino-4-deoxy-L-arabinose transferase-like glycosyltransferase